MSSTGLGRFGLGLLWFCLQLRIFAKQGLNFGPCPTSWKWRPFSFLVHPLEGASISPCINILHAPLTLLHALLLYLRHCVSYAASTGRPNSYLVQYIYRAHSHTCDTLVSCIPKISPILKKYPYIFYVRTTVEFLRDALLGISCVTFFFWRKRVKISRR